MFFGCYANTRQILDRCYEELNNSGAPYKFASFDEAFDPIDQVVLGQHADDSWQFVTLEFPRDQDSPNFGGFVSDCRQLDLAQPSTSDRRGQRRTER